MQSFNDQANPPPRVLRVLVACEFSGTVRDAFLEKGHDAWSCDLLPAEHNSNRHIQCDVREILDDGWDCRSRISISKFGALSQFWTFNAFIPTIAASNRLSAVADDAGAQFRHELSVA